jgi:DNA-binding NarL/FixJ family response regulator
VRFRAILVDDVPGLRAVMRVALEGSGRFDVVGEAEDGVAGVELAERAQPDLVLLDVSMPRRDGFESLPLIRAVSPRSKVVMLSGFDGRRLAGDAVELGASAYLEKGLPPNRLVAEVMDVLVPARL